MKSDEITLIRKFSKNIVENLSNFLYHCLNKKGERAYEEISLLVLETASDV